jgi:peptidoglycan/xylan/chitin deacetylase (PgdA/CDA1 family)
LAIASSFGAMACGAARSLENKKDLEKSPNAASSMQLERFLAVTVDDLPWFGRLAPGDSPVEVNRKLLAELSARSVHATGFVVCDNAESQSGVLDAWLTSGMDLGNHTARHLDLNTTDLAAWIKDVEECHEQLSRIAGKPPQYFRYPMLHQGDTLDKRTGAAAALKRLGYTLAHVTVDNSEWLLASAYGRALEDGDTERSDRIAQVYVEHLLSGIEHFDEVGRAEFGRWPPHVLLVHANALAADHIGEVLDAVKARGVHIVPLEEVLKDPIFSRKDVYVGRKGLSWLYRTSAGAFERWGAWDDAEATRIRANFPEEQD